MKTGNALSEFAPWGVAVSILAIAIIGHVTWYREGYRWDTVESVWRRTAGQIKQSPTCLVSFYALIPRDKMWEIYLPQTPAKTIWEAGRNNPRRCNFHMDVMGGEIEVTTYSMQGEGLNRRRVEKKYKMSPGEPARVGLIQRLWIKRLSFDSTYFIIQWHDVGYKPELPLSPATLRNRVTIE